MLTDIIIWAYIDAAYRLILSEMRKRRMDGDDEKRMSSSDSKSSMTVSSSSSHSSRASHTGNSPLTRKQEFDSTRSSSSSTVSITLSLAQTQNANTQPNSSPHSRTLILEFSPSLMYILTVILHVTTLTLRSRTRQETFFPIQCQRSGKCRPLHRPLVPYGLPTVISS